METDYSQMELPELIDLMTEMTNRYSEAFRRNKPNAELDKLRHELKKLMEEIERKHG